MGSERSEKSGVIWVAVVRQYSEWLVDSAWVVVSVQAFTSEIVEEDVDFSMCTEKATVGIYEVELKGMEESK